MAHALPISNTPATSNRQPEHPRNLKGERRFRHLREQINLMRELNRFSVAKSIETVAVASGNRDSESARWDDSAQRDEEQDSNNEKLEQAVGATFKERQANLEEHEDAGGGDEVEQMDNLVQEELD